MKRNQEKIVNLFLFVNDGIIREIGAKWREGSGKVEQKIALLQACVREDVKTCKRYPMPYGCVIVTEEENEIRGAMTYDTFVAIGGTGKQIEILEQAVFSKCKFAPRDPVIVMTPVVDGIITIDEVVGPPD